MTLTPDDIYQGQYRVVREISPDGATAVVYELYHVVLRQSRALKRGVARGRVTADQIARRFETERDALRLLDAGGTFAPALYEYDPAVPELLMTYFAGPPLRWLLGRWYNGVGAFPDDARLARFARRLAEAVAACHVRGVVLTDLKPENVLVEPGDAPGEGRPVLIDFGSAVLTDRPPPAERDGTPPYAAPELTGGGAVGPATDVYSLGALVYALFRRAEPPPDRSVRDFGERRTAVLPDVQKLVLAMVAADPADRPTMADVVALLAAAEAELATPAGAAACPKCGSLLPAGGARFCPDCKVAVSRDTKPYNPAAGTADPVRRMYDAERDGLPGDGVYWARVAVARQPLTAAQRLTALELAVQIESAREFAGELVRVTDPDQLPAELRLPFLAALAVHLRAAGRQFAPYRAAFAAAAAARPDDERMWVGLAEATPTAERDAVFEAALAHHPNSPALLESRGDTLAQAAGAAAAVGAWAAAVAAGGRGVPLLCRLWWAAGRTAPAHRDRAAALLRGVVPRTVAEAKQLLAVAAAECAAAGPGADAGWRIDLADAALELELGRAEFQEAKAAALFDQQKYLLAAEFAERSGYTPVLREVRGRAYLELGRLPEARQVLEELTASDPTPGRFLYLTRTFAKLGHGPAARDAVARGHRMFPDDPTLRRLYESM